MQAGVCFWVPSLDVLPDAPAGYQWAVVSGPLCDPAIVSAGAGAGASADVDANVSGAGGFLLPPMPGNAYRYVKGRLLPPHPQMAPPPVPVRHDSPAVLSFGPSARQREWDAGRADIMLEEWDVDDELLARMEARENAELGCDVKNEETFGEYMEEWSWGG